MARYGYGMSVSGSKASVVPSSGGGGAGFPDVASTNQIAITNITGTMFGVANNGIGTYTKNGVFNGSGGGSVQYAFDTDGNALITFDETNRWVLYKYNGDNTDQYAINLSSDPTTIPTTGWSPSITITAA
jgi:hypothetical protein